MAQIRVENLRKSFDQFTAVQRFEFHDRERQFFCAARSVRMWQDHHAADDRGPRAADRWAHSARRRGRNLSARGGARYRLRLSVLRALSAHECRAEHQLSAQVPGHGAPRYTRAGGGDRAAPAHRTSAVEQDVGIVRRRSAAGCARPRHGQATEGVHDG